MSQVGVYEAKTHLPRLLEKVAAGERITITKHGRSVAMLQPVEGNGRNVSAVIRDLKQFRRDNTLNGLSVREMLNEGRD